MGLFQSKIESESEDEEEVDNVLIEKIKIFLLEFNNQSIQEEKLVCEKKILEAIQKCEEDKKYIFRLTTSEQKSHVNLIKYMNYMIVILKLLYLTIFKYKRIFRIS